MKPIDSLDQLKSWQEYRNYMKESLKLVDGEVVCFVTKDKLEFDMDGKPWKGHAFLAGKKAILTVKQLKKQGVIFREGVCTRNSKDLHIGALEPVKLLKEAEKTFLKLRLGYKVHAAEATGGGASPAPEGRAKKVEELKQMEQNLDRLLAALNQQA